MIAIRKLSKYFYRGSINEVLALDRIELNIESGDFITVIGSNGAGKSTLLNCLAGTFLPDSGSLRLHDRDITRWPEHRRARFVGRVFQDPLTGTCASLSIEQNMAMAVRRGGRRGLKIGVSHRQRETFQRHLKTIGLGLEDRLKSSVGLLSGGQRQALTMAMATLVEPEILLLDEHTAALDPKTAVQILELTRELVERRRLTTLMVTHNMNHALSFGNRLVMLHRGRVLFDVRGHEKEHLTKEDLIQRFYDAQGEEFSTDRMLLG
jgi:putative ABC transport system ATP-binding protein